jgi:hypothetical protein
MGQLKQLHIDCNENECLAGMPATCYMLRIIKERTSVIVSKIAVKSHSRAYKIKVRVV